MAFLYIYLNTFIFRVYNGNLQYADQNLLIPIAFAKPLALTGTLSTSASGLYAVNWINLNYTGPIFKLRSSGGGTSDFYTDKSCSLASITTGPNGTGTSFSTWIGASTAYVDTWYDQSTLGRNATQANTPSQPIFDAINKKVTFSGSQYLKMTSAVPTAFPFTVSYKHDNYINDVAPNRSTFVANGTWNSNIAFRTIESGGGYMVYFWGGSGVSNTTTNANKNKVTYVGSSNNITIYVNGGNSASGAFTMGTFANGTVSTIGTVLSSNLTTMNEPAKGDLYGVFLFNTNLNSTDQTTMEGLYV